MQGVVLLATHNAGKIDGVQNIPVTAGLASVHHCYQERRHFIKRVGKFFASLSEILVQALMRLTPSGLVMHLEARAEILPDQRVRIQINLTT